MKDLTDNPPFTVIIPVRGTEEDRYYLIKSMPSMVKLGPQEIIFAVDDPVPSALEKNLQQICTDCNFDRYRLVPTPRKWNMQLAAVMYNCLQHCKTDRALLVDCDSVMVPTILDGLDVVGRDGVAIYSGQPYFAAAPFLFRFCNSYLPGRTKFFETGVYLAYVPYILSVLDKDMLAKIRCGLDSIVYEQVEKSEYKIKMVDKITHRVLGRPTLAVDWVQYSKGLYVGVHNLDNYDSETALRRVMKKYFPALPFLWKSLKFGSMWYYRGYRWACNNPDDPASSLARSCKTELEWWYEGSNPISAHHDWKHESAGFVKD